jgi:hypothetical protein
MLIPRPVTWSTHLLTSLRAGKNIHIARTPPPPPLSLGYAQIIFAWSWYIDIPNLRNKTPFFINMDSWTGRIQHNYVSYTPVPSNRMAGFRARLSLQKLNLKRSKQFFWKTHNYLIGTNFQIFLYKASGLWYHITLQYNLQYRNYNYLCNVHVQLTTTFAWYI